MHVCLGERAHGAAGVRRAAGANVRQHHSVSRSQHCCRGTSRQSEALLLHGEAGPMTIAFQPEQPARHLSSTLRFLEPRGDTRRKDGALERVIASVSGQTQPAVFPRSALRLRVLSCYHDISQQYRGVAPLHAAHSRTPLVHASANPPLFVILSEARPSRSTCICRFFPLPEGTSKALSASPTNWGYFTAAPAHIDEMVSPAPPSTPQTPPAPTAPGCSARRTRGGAGTGC